MGAPEGKPIPWRFRVRGKRQYVVVHAPPDRWFVARELALPKLSRVHKRDVSPSEIEEVRDDD